MRRIVFLRRSAFLLCWLFVAVAQGYAHSGKARVHAIVDTDVAADDLRAICMLLGNAEVEVLAVTTSEGALLPADGAVRVAALLGEFHHEGVPVGAGRAVHAPVPEWRTRSERIDWGDTTAVARRFPGAVELMARTIEGEQERVVILALGAMTNVRELLGERPDLKDRIERIVWYNEQTDPPAGVNFDTDRAAARDVLGSGVPVTVVAANPAHPIVITPALLDSIAAVGTPYACKIARTHRSEPVATWIDQRHLEAWDDLLAVYLFAPELFECREIGRSLSECRLRGRAAARAAEARIAAVLRGKPDAESRVFYGFPAQRELYAADVAPLVDSAIARYGESEWRAGVLTNELHGHLGIYAIVGVKMGLRAREYFDIGVDDVYVTTYAGDRPPVSCMNDGLQVGTGATLGHGLIVVSDEGPVRPEARFRFKDKTIRLMLKPEYARRIREDVKRGIELYGDLTEPYWQYIRKLALNYWLEFDRHEMFDLYVEQ